MWLVSNKRWSPHRHFLSPHSKPPLIFVLDVNSAFVRIFCKSWACLLRCKNCMFLKPITLCSFKLFTTCAIIWKTLDGICANESLIFGEAYLLVTLIDFVEFPLVSWCRFELFLFFLSFCFCCVKCFCFVSAFSAIVHIRLTILTGIFVLQWVGWYKI